MSVCHKTTPLHTPRSYRALVECFKCHTAFSDDEYAYTQDESTVTPHLPAPPKQFDVRLVGGTNESEGRVEIFYDNEWGTVCDDFWDLKDATVVCRQLGYPVAIRKSTLAEFGRGRGPIHLDNVQCQGDEDELHLCRAVKWGISDCTHREDAGVVCSSELDPCSQFAAALNTLYSIQKAIHSLIWVYILAFQCIN